MVAVLGPTVLMYHALVRKTGLCMVSHDGLQEPPRRGMSLE